LSIQNGMMIPGGRSSLQELVILTNRMYDDGNSMVIIQTLRWVFEEREKMAIRYSHPELSTI